MGIGEGRAPAGAKEGCVLRPPLSVPITGPAIPWLLGVLLFPHQLCLCPHLALSVAGWARGAVPLPPTLGPQPLILGPQSFS